MTEELIRKPAHYARWQIEPITYIEAALSPEEFRGYCKGNIIKYTWREGYKNGDEDLNKAAWYMERLRTYEARMAEKG